MLVAAKTTASFKNTPHHIDRPYPVQHQRSLPHTTMPQTTVYPSESDYYDFLACGLYGDVYKYGDTGVIKRLLPEPQAEDVESLEIEKSIFKRLMENPHPRIVRCLDIGDDYIVLERLQETLRARFSGEGAEVQAPPSSSCRLRWAVEAAEGLNYLHQLGILQPESDVSATNIMLDSEDHLKYIDFSGASIDGRPANVSYCERNISPHSVGTGVPTVGQEIFALGSVLYKIETGHMPYPELGKRGEVEKKDKALEFPEVD
ncbi:kinase-like domain-containing protein [Tuber borchii]|uniref:Kinase-like domain-containing protein n=1 Tax=Tuber borchii TaxID=42251 RepID=A0A2T6Z9H1_TUBBO|nr:kinase-like domain-containing protein [Tuber borchii]